MSIELLNLEKILPLIALDLRPALSQCILLPTIDSTNSYLLQHGEELCSTSVCMAEQQTAGRGTMGKSWFSPYGKNIYCSLLWEFPSQPGDNLAGLSLAVAVMVVQALQYYGVAEGWQLKWPNDLWYARRKLAGILIEKVREKVVIGIGLNIDLSATANTPPDWIDLQEIITTQPQRNRLAGLLINELLKQLPLYAEQGLAPFLPEWQRYDVLLGQRVTAKQGNTTITGVAQGVNAAGELLILVEGGVRAFRSAEVRLVDG